MFSPRWIFRALSTMNSICISFNQTKFILPLGLFQLNFIVRLPKCAAALAMIVFFSWNICFCVPSRHIRQKQSQWLLGTIIWNIEWINLNKMTSMLAQSFDFYCFTQNTLIASHDRIMCLKHSKNEYFSRSEKCLLFHDWSILPKNIYLSFG